MWEGMGVGVQHALIEGVLSSTPVCQRWRSTTKRLLHFPLQALSSPWASYGSVPPSPFHYFPKHVQISFLATDSARGDTAGGGEVRGMGKLVTGGEMPPSSNKTGSGGENKTEQTLQPSGLAQPAVSPPRAPGQPQACLASRGLSPESLRLHGPSSGDQPSPGRGCRSSASGCSALCSDAGSSWNPEAS